MLTHQRLDAARQWLMEPSALRGSGSKLLNGWFWLQQLANESQTMDAHPTALLIDRPLIHASLYDLAAVVFGSEGLAKQSSGDAQDEFDKLRLRHEIGLATKLLIEVAVVLRNLLDGEQWPVDVIHEARVSKRPEEYVGTLLAEGASASAFSFREACNKLIHAQRISFGMQELPGRMAYLNGTATLHGTKAGRAWVANVDLAKFVRMAVRQI